MRLDAHSRSEFSQQWRRRLEDKASVAMELEAAVRAFDPASFAFGGVYPGTLHAHGKLVDAHRVSYSVGIAGDYLLHVRLRKPGLSLPGSPFHLVVQPGPASPLSSHFPTEELVGDVEGGCEYVLTTADKMGNACVEGGETFHVLCSSPDVTSECEDLQDGSYRLKWSTSRTGTFQTFCQINGAPILRSPATLRFETSTADITRSVLSGDGLRVAVSRRPALIHIRFRDRHGNSVAPGAGFRASTRFGLALCNDKDALRMQNDLGKGDSKGKAGLTYIMKHLAMEFESEWLPAREGFQLKYSANTTGAHQLHLWTTTEGTVDECQPVPEPFTGSPFKIQVERNPEDIVTTIGGTAPADYMLERSVFEDAQRRWGAFSVDAFASEATALLPCFWTAVETPGAAATDAMMQPWLRADGVCIWAHPPISMLTRLAQFLQSAERTAEVVVCCPHWIKLEWFKTLEKLSDESTSVVAVKLQRVAEDAPARLEEWPSVIFHIPAVQSRTLKSTSLSVFALSRMATTADVARREVAIADGGTHEQTEGAETAGAEEALPPVRQEGIGDAGTPEEGVVC